jgi:hypothetical protein
MKTKAEAGQNRPGAFAFFDPGASTPELHQKIRKSKTLCQSSRFHTACPQRVMYSRFFGASPVVSALDLRSGRDPGANGITLRLRLHCRQAAR